MWRYYLLNILSLTIYVFTTYTAEINIANFFWFIVNLIVYPVCLT